MPRVSDDASLQGGVQGLCFLASWSMMSEGQGSECAATMKAVVEAASALLSDLPVQDAEALKQLEEAGRRCLTALAVDTVAAIRDLAASFSVSKGSEKLAEAHGQDDGNSCQMSAATMHKMFVQFDTDGDGLISLLDFGDVMKRLGAAATFSEEEIRALAAAADANGDGYVDEAEFVAWLGSSAADSAPTTEEEHDDSAADVLGDLLRNEQKRMQSLVSKANSRAQALEVKLEDVANKHRIELHRAEERLRKTEATLEDDSNASVQFWRNVAKTSSSSKLGKVANMESLEVIGHGKYGYVMKATRTKDRSQCVVKVMSTRWAHIAIREWHIGQLVDDHINIVAAEYKDVLLHADDDGRLAQILTASLQREQDGSKPSKRAALPDTWICCVQEFMNGGTVQDCIDRNSLLPEGLLSVMQSVASALAYMHQRNVSHNDIKPANILLHQEFQGMPLLAKLGDLGLAAKSKDHSNDFNQYGMTAFCMTSGEQFGKRKFKPDLVPTLLSELEALTSSAGGDCDGDAAAQQRVVSALQQLPDLLRKIWAGDVLMVEVREWPALQGWKIYDAPEADGN
eukprot:TRINITY_DN123080_c0_g1_i1.p1 TRINITY_DN123080_c0_g1~~TRINITY_DN123080_c0_g1_i1.p1  ORF type:complete len:592 (+),score=122.47 TRINITY_DN123080_c0_g1_i1:66-1778(+)